MPIVRNTIFQFGRLNLVGQWDDKRTYVHSSLTKRIDIERGSFRYGFFDVQEINSEDEAFVYGRLVKYKILLEEEVVDEETHELATGAIPRGVVAKSDFFLHYRTGVLAFRPISNKISPGQFRDAFAKLIEKANDNFFINASVQLIGEEIEIRDALARFQAIYRVFLSVHPSNPSNRDDWDRLDDRLKRLGARELRETVVARRDGLNLEAFKSDELYSGVIMAADGYGKADVTGFIDGGEVTISTEDSTVEATVILSKQPNEMLFPILEVMRRIWERISNDH